MSSIESMINKRRQVDEDDSDFSVGTIPGLEDNDNEIVSVVRQLNGPKTTKEESATPMTVKATIKETEGVTPEMLEGTVSLKTRNEDLAELISQTNEDVIVQSSNKHFQINAKQIRVSRGEVERKLGKRLNDGEWRMLFINRTGEVYSFTDHEFILGIVELEIEERKEQAQINTRIDAEAKSEMDSVRQLLNMTQAQFLEVAIKEYAEKVRAELI